MNKVAIFGYGSLMNKASFERTLGRRIDPSEFSWNYLNGYARSWTLYHEVKNLPEEKKLLLPPTKKYIVYLDITPKANSKIIGSLVTISSQELLKFDAREINYDRIDVTDNLDAIPDGITVYTYIGNKRYKTALVPLSECVIIKEYIEIVESGVNNLCEADRDEFWKSTIRTDIDIVSVPGFYKI